MRYIQSHVADDRWIIIDNVSGQEACMENYRCGSLNEADAVFLAYLLNWLEDYTPLSLTPWMPEE